METEPSPTGFMPLTGDPASDAASLAAAYGMRLVVAGDGSLLLTPAGVSPTEVRRAVADALRSLPRGGTTHEVADLVSALGLLPLRGPELLAAIERCVAEDAGRGEDAMLGRSGERLVLLSEPDEEGVHA